MSAVCSRRWGSRQQAVAPALASHLRSAPSAVRRAIAAPSTPPALAAVQPTWRTRSCAARRSRGVPLAPRVHERARARRSLRPCARALRRCLLTAPQRAAWRDRREGCAVQRGLHGPRVHALLPETWQRIPPAPRLELRAVPERWVHDTSHRRRVRRAAYIRAADDRRRARGARRPCPCSLPPTHAARHSPAPIPPPTHPPPRATC